MSHALQVEELLAAARQRHATNDLSGAEQLYEKILELDRTHLDARHMLGVLRLQQGRAADAFSILEPLAREVPGDAGIRTHRGLALQELGRLDEALADFDLALRLKPDHKLSLLYRGNLLLQAARPGQALENYDRLLRMSPDNDEAWFRRGSALWLLDRFEEALASYRKSLSLNPNRFGAAFNSGTTLLKLEHYDEAYAAFERARALTPHHPYLLGATAAAILGACDLERWGDFQSRLINAVAKRSMVIPPLTFMPFCDDGNLRRACSEMFVADRVPQPIVPLWTGQHYNHDRIRIAYLSADFHQHATAELMAGLIEHHDRTRFEVAAISFSRDDASAMRTRLMKAFDRFEDVRFLDDAGVAQLLRSQEFDIAVDLKGHTEGARPAILAHRPCPVQVNYLGYPGTIGGTWLDYIIADATVLPFYDQPFYSEKIVHLPHCYQPNDQARTIAMQTPLRVQAGLPETGFVFCCFNAAWKISPLIFDVWMRLLAAVPGSILWLLQDNADMIGHLRRAAQARGVDPARLVFAPHAAPAAHLARYRLADLFLDTLPYNAHTTASDALWSGLPVLTCKGSQFDGRVATSLLQTIGLPELITESLQAYEVLAQQLASDRDLLTALRSRLAANRLSSPLFNIDRFRQAIEQAYLRMLDISRSGEAPQSFTVEA